ncbi:hypothetical protein Slin15195_G122400 [Septoria linicola]|uniref:Uncharacterized protein n=1 Tax=Septoria linicola TaxID=215465 RepID=A0A9Q9EPM5_9PEZI|nr:hypothetical protein Slin14017_G078600 [Septoria linicola]USW58921.1 hypothetical protein Slin15195_G122400 [Septoria linicola]
MARRRFARTLTARSTDYIKEVLPEQMAEKLWEWLVRNGAASLSAWKVFAATGYFGSGHTKVLSLSCTRQQCLHFAVLRADMTWLTDLTIGGEGLSGDTLSSIPRLCNLRTFHLRLDGRPSREAQALLSDRTLRAWAADAAERNALSKLEMIVVDEQTDITISVLQYLNGFPSLDTFATRKCGIDAREEVTRRVIAGESQRVGWRAGPGTSMHTFLRNNKGPSHHHYRSWPTLVRNWADDRQSQNNLPVLSVLAGVRQDLCEMKLRTDTWCFERYWSHEPPIDSQQERSPSRKRRKVNRDFSATQDMMSGIF